MDIIHLHSPPEPEMIIAKMKTVSQKRLQIDEISGLELGWFEQVFDRNEDRACARGTRVQRAYGGPRPSATLLEYQQKTRIVFYTRQTHDKILL